MKPTQVPVSISLMISLYSYFNFQSVNVEEKYCGLQTFAMLIEAPESLEQVLNRGVVRVAAPLLLDPAASVRNAAAGALRNMSAIKMEVCDAMMDQDVMTPVTCYFHEVIILIYYELTCLAAHVYVIKHPSENVTDQCISGYTP